MSEIVFFNDEAGDVSVDVLLDREGSTVWLTQEQMAGLFEKNRSVITKCKSRSNNPPQ